MVGVRTGGKGSNGARGSGLERASTAPFSWRFCSRSAIGGGYDRAGTHAAKGATSVNTGDAASSTGVNTGDAAAPTGIHHSHGQDVRHTRASIGLHAVATPRPTSLIVTRSGRGPRQLHLATASRTPPAPSEPRHRHELCQSGLQVTKPAR